MTAVVDAPAAEWLACHGLTKHYAGVRALRGIDLTLREGEIHGLIGPNGAGKSTLVKALAGAVSPDGGEIRLDGEVVSLSGPGAAAAHGLVLMPQEITLVPAATVVDNINLGTEPVRFGLRDASRARRVATEALAMVGLDVDLDVPASALSPAHQRMLMMARAVHRRARLLILDEPTAGLPHHEAELVGAALRRLACGTLTVVYVSHYLSEVARLCDRVTCIREGQVTATLGSGELSKDRLVELLTGVPSRSEVARAAPAAPSVSSAPSAEFSEPALALLAVHAGRLRGVSCAAHRGQVTGITGLLGSGVADLAGLIVGRQRPGAGALTIDGRPVVLRSPADALGHGIGYLPGDRTQAAFAAMSIRANVSIGALRAWFGRTGLLRPRVEARRAQQALDALSVSGDSERTISVLSGGNQQRALVARLIAADCRVIVLDEPTVGVDIKARGELWQEVRSLAETRTVVVCSSEPEELIALCERVICLRDGSISATLEGDAITETAIAHAIA